MRRAASSNFVRACVVIVLGIVGVALLLDLLLASFARQNNEDLLSLQYAPLFALIERELTDHEPETMARQLAASTTGIGIDVNIVPLAAFGGDGELGASEEIRLFYDSDGAPMLYRRLPATEQVLAIGPLPVREQGSAFEHLVISAYYALVALILLLWLRPFYRDLGLLRQASTEFGKHDFSTRVQLCNKSSILPVAQSFNSMAERIEYLVSAHRELTNAVSHELRTPLARFKFSLEMVSRADDPERRRQYLDDMKIDVAELEALVDEMLNYALLSEQNLLMNLVEVDLRQWLQQELAIYARERIAVNASFAIQPSNGAYRGQLNPALMARAIHNIIRNGLRYAQASINVHMQLNDTAVTIRICDDGPGIPPAMHAKIFEPFSRLETSRDKVSGGYGLGLAIAARILQRHQGSISVQNCAPMGTCFVLSWPPRPDTSPE